MKTDELKWYGDEKYALVNKETNSIFLGSDDKQVCIDAKIRMTPKHPMFDKLILIERK